MQLVNQLQLFTAISVLILVNRTFRVCNSRIDVPFLGTISTCMIMLLLMSFAPVNVYVWIFIVILVIGLNICSYKYFRVNVTTEKIPGFRISFQAIAWIVAIIVTITLTGIIQFFPPASTDFHKVSRQDLFISQVFSGEDNISHINIVRSIQVNGRTTYFISEGNKNFTVNPSLVGYAQLPHVAGALFDTAVSDISAVRNNPESETSRMAMSYAIMSYLLLGMAIGLTLTFAIRLIHNYVTIGYLGISLSCFAGGVYAAYYFGTPILVLGFFSQSAGLVALFLMLHLELDPQFRGLARRHPLITTTIRTVPLLAIAHTWWLLLPIAAVFFLFRSASMWYEMIKAKRHTQLFLQGSIALVAAIICFIPIYSQFLSKNMALTSFSNAGGPTPVLSVRIVIASLFFVTIVSSAIYIKAKDSQKDVILIIAEFSIIAFLFMAAFAIYQITTLGHFSYYGFKLAGTLKWFTLAIGFAAIQIIFIGVVQRLPLVAKKNVVMIAMIVVLTFFSGFYVRFISYQARAFRSAFDIQQLSDFSRALDEANKEEKLLIPVSDCGGYIDYFFQRAASSLQARFTHDTFFYSGGVFFPETKEEAREKLYSHNANDYYFFDLTPLSDEHPPSQRTPLKHSKGMRTSLNNPIGNDLSASFCSSEVVNSWPK